MGENDLGAKKSGNVSGKVGVHEGCVHALIETLRTVECVAVCSHGSGRVVWCK